MDSLQHLLARDEIYQERVRKIQTHRNRIQNLQNQRTREQQELNELRSMQLNPETTRELRRLEQNVPALAYMIDTNEVLIREEERGMMRRRMEIHFNKITCFTRFCWVSKITTTSRNNGNF